MYFFEFVAQNLMLPSTEQEANYLSENGFQDNFIALS